MAQLNSLIVTGDSRFLNTINGDITGDAGTVNGHTVNSNVPSNAVFTDTNNCKSFFGTCSTAAATAAKVVTLSNTDGWELKAGTVVGVKFSVTNTASNVTLNVNDSGPKSIYFSNAVYTDSANQICGYSNTTTFYMYDGTYWVYINTGSNYRDTDTHRVVKVNGTQVLASNTTALNLVSGNNISISGNSNGNVTINAGAWSSSVTGVVGSTSVTISDSNITTSSTIIPFCENNSGTSIPFTSISVSTNSVILSFPELTEVTSFKLLII